MSQCKSCGGFCGQYGCERERSTAAAKMTREQWIKKVMWAYEHGARHGAERQLFQSMLANIPEPEGWKLAPLDADVNMIVTGFEAVSDFQDTEEFKELSGCKQSYESAKLCYSKMIEASPKHREPT